MTNYTFYTFGLHLLSPFTFFFLSTCDVKCNDVGWSDGIYVKWFYFEVKWSEVKLKWSEVSYGEFLAGAGAMYIMVALYWGNYSILWLFHLGISCTVFVLICTVMVLNCFVMCVCVCVRACVVGWVLWCVGVLVMCILWIWTCFYYRGADRSMMLAVQGECRKVRKAICEGMAQFKFVSSSIQGA
jgi:hypothetical protein